MKGITHYWQSLNWLSRLLLPLSLLYCLFIRLRKFCYQRHCIKSSLSQAPVIVIGNITVGGNGKTPLIIYLLEEFKRRGYSPGVVSRGYGAQNPQLKNAKVLAVDIANSAKLYGDEPWMIAKNTSCPVVVGIKRAKAVEYLVKEFACDMVLSDDGLQHYAMGRDIEVCVVDTSKLFGNGFCLPAGPLREPVSRLKEVDYIVYHQTDRINKKDQNIYMQLDFDHIYSLGSCSISAGGSQPQKLTISAFKNKTFHAVAGIANPERFFNQLRKFGLNVIEHPFADHYQFIQADLEFADDYPVIMTEKDAVKCYLFTLNNCFYISVKVALSTDLVGSIIEKLSKPQLRLDNI